MKILSLIFMLLFSLTTLVDTCGATDALEDCVKVMKTKDCTDQGHPDSDHQETHCARTCTPKVLIIPVLSLTIVGQSYVLSYPSYSELFLKREPVPLLRPPIALS